MYEKENGSDLVQTTCFLNYSNYTGNSVKEKGKHLRHHFTKNWVKYISCYAIKKNYD